MRVAVVLVIHDAHMCGSVVRAQILRDGDHVLRLTVPAAVIINGKLAAELPRLLHGGQQRLRGQFHFLLLGGRSGVRCHEPDLRMELVLLKEREGFVMRAPEREELDAVLLILQNLLLELRHMLLAPVVGHFLQPQFRHHLRALRRRALFRIERHDAPRGEIAAIEDVRLSADGEREEEAEQGAKDRVHGEVSNKRRRATCSPKICAAATTLRTAPSRSSEVMTTPSIPQGVIAANPSNPPQTLSANPC